MRRKSAGALTEWLASTARTCMRDSVCEPHLCGFFKSKNQGNSAGDGNKKMHRGRVAAYQKGFISGTDRCRNYCLHCDTIPFSNSRELENGRTIQEGNMSPSFY